MSRDTDEANDMIQPTELDEGARSWLEDQLAAVAATPTARSHTEGAPIETDAAPVDPGLRAMLEIAERRGATDLHISVGATARLRHHGRMQTIHDFEALGEAQLERMLTSTLTARGRGQLDTEGSADTIVQLRSGMRVRANIFRGASGIGAAFRLLPDAVPPLEDLGLPPTIAELAAAPRGLLLLTGATGSGKTTTIAALVEQVIGPRPLHVITIEDPIEYRFSHLTALVTQRQIGEHAPDFPHALRQALRQDPDVIVIGEMRDPDTIAAALTAAETGHLVLATLHSRTAQGAISRIVESFGDGRQEFVRTQLANALVGVVSQQLVPAAHHGRVLATEVLVATTGVSSLIREGRLHQIAAAVDAGASRGMQSMDRSLAALVRRGLISSETAAARCVDPTGLRELLR